MEKSNSNKKERTAFKPDKRFSGWTAVFELAVPFLRIGLLNGCYKEG